MGSVSTAASPAAPFACICRHNYSAAASIELIVPITQPELTLALPCPRSCRKRSPQLRNLRSAGMASEGPMRPFSSKARCATPTTQAIEADPRFLPPYMTLVRLFVKTKDWQCVSQDALVRGDPQHSFQEVYLHRAAAPFELTDLEGAESDAQEGLRLDTHHKLSRRRMCSAAFFSPKETPPAPMSTSLNWLELNPTAADASMVKAYLDNPAQTPAPDLDPVYFF